MIAPAQPDLIDYPAAHSMDTTWFAVDENGELGCFQSDAEGDVPVLEGMESDEILEAPVSVQQAHDFATCNTYVDIAELIYDAGRAWLGPPPQGSRAKWDESDVEQLCFHNFSVNWRGWYYWNYSSERPMTYADLPEPLRNGRHILRLKDYAFSSRDPVNPFEHARNCYTMWCETTYGESPTGTVFPIPTRRRCWLDEDLPELKNDVAGGMFFAVDAEERLALFRSGHFGIRPADPVASYGVHYWPELLKEFASAGLWSTESTQKPCHWLEYPFINGYPRSLGLYHYDMSWLHAAPFVRIAAPRQPLHLGTLPVALVDKLRPVRLPQANFERHRLIQPLEHAAFFPYRSDYSSVPYRQSEMWIDSALSAVNLFGPDCVNFDIDERLLRRARNFCLMVDEMARNEQP